MNEKKNTLHASCHVQGKTRANLVGLFLRSDSRATALEDAHKMRPSVKAANRLVLARHIEGLRKLLAYILGNMCHRDRHAA